LFFFLLFPGLPDLAGCIAACKIFNGATCHGYPFSPVAKIKLFLSPVAKANETFY